jgi:hypothetical protein
MNAHRSHLAAMALCSAACTSPGAAPAGGNDSERIEDVSIAAPYSPANTMMFEVAVTLSDHADDDDHDVSVGFAPHGTDCETGDWKMGKVQRFADTDTLSWILYNFQPGETYDYKVARGADVECGALGTPELPAALAALQFTYDKGDHATRYVLMDTDDCGGTDESRRYVIALDPETENIVWYLDVAARSTAGGSNLNGWRFQPGETDRILGQVDKRYLYEWGWDGSVLSVMDVGPNGECNGTSQGPCIHHDSYRSEFSGKTFIIASAQSDVDGTGTVWDVCGSGSRFLDDGFQIWNPELTAYETKSLMDDYGYDPTQDGGPNSADEEGDTEACDANIWESAFDPYGTIDWTHLNSLTASSFGGGEVIDLSLKEWDQTLRVDDAGTLLWRLSGNPAYSDWAMDVAQGISGEARFVGQHDVHAVGPDALMMLDNLGDGVGSRVLRLQLDDATRTATIDRSWAIADPSGAPLLCRLEGSAQEVPGTEGESVVSMCNDAFTVVEMDDATGNPAPPALAIALPEDGFCSEGGPPGRFGIHGWYRAFSVAEIGDF